MFRRRKIRSLFPLAVVLVVLSLAPVSSAATLSPEQQQRFDRVTSQLIAPCCWSESVRVHRSEVAAQMRSEIAGMITEGKTNSEILNFYVQKYSEKVLMLPEGAKRDWLFVIPVVMLLIGGVVVILVLKRLKRGQPVPAAAGSSAIVEVKDSDLEW